MCPLLLRKDAVGQSRPLGECRGKRGTPGLGSLHGMVLVRKEVPGRTSCPGVRCLWSFRSYQVMFCSLVVVLSSNFIPKYSERRKYIYWTENLEEENKDHLAARQEFLHRCAVQGGPHSFTGPRLPWWPSYWLGVCAAQGLFSRTDPRGPARTKD